MRGNAPAVLVHSLSLQLSRAHLSFLGLRWRDVLRSAFGLELLFLNEHLHDFQEVELELVRVAGLFLLQLLEGDDVPTKTVVHLPRQHQLLLVELEEDL